MRQSRRNQGDSSAMREVLFGGSQSTQITESATNIQQRG